MLVKQVGRFPFGIAAQTQGGDVVFNTPFFDMIDQGPANPFISERFSHYQSTYFNKRAAFDPDGFECVYPAYDEVFVHGNKTAVSFCKRME